MIRNLKVKMFFSAVILFFIVTQCVYAKQINVQVVSATIKDKVIADATLIFQKNGFESVKGKTNSQGIYTGEAPFGGVDDNSVLLIIKKDGYANLVVKCPCNNLTYALSESMKNAEAYRIVLNWGRTPADLDSHLVYPDNHVYFDHKIGSGANLDVDDTTSFGPETITITKREEGQMYVYAVHDYTNKEITGKDLSNSKAVVFVYSGNELIQTYYITPQVNSTLWVLFAIDENNMIKDIHQYTFAKDNKDVDKILRSKNWTYKTSLEDYTNRYLNNGDILYTIIDKGRLRDAPNLNSNTLDYVDINEDVTYLGEQSNNALEITLRGQKYKSPFLKIKRKNGKEGWIYGGGLRKR